MSAGRVATGQSCSVVAPINHGMASVSRSVAPVCPGVTVVSPSVMARQAHAWGFQPLLVAGWAAGSGLGSIIAVHSVVCAAGCCLSPRLLRAKHFKVCPRYSTQWGSPGGVCDQVF